VCVCMCVWLSADETGSCCPLKTIVKVAVCSSCAFDPDLWGARQSLQAMQKSLALESGESEFAS
jgi:hypothetical protein